MADILRCNMQIINSIIRCTHEIAPNNVKCCNNSVGQERQRQRERGRRGSVAPRTRTINVWERPGDQAAESRFDMAVDMEQQYESGLEEIT